MLNEVSRSLNEIWSSPVFPFSFIHTVDPVGQLEWFLCLELINGIGHLSIAVKGFSCELYGVGKILAVHKQVCRIHQVVRGNNAHLVRGPGLVGGCDVSHLVHLQITWVSRDALSESRSLVCSNYFSMQEDCKIFNLRPIWSTAAITMVGNCEVKIISYLGNWVPCRHIYSVVKVVSPRIPI